MEWEARQELTRLCRQKGIDVSDADTLFDYLPKILIALVSTLPDSTQWQTQKISPAKTQTSSL